MILRPIRSVVASVVATVALAAAAPAALAQQADSLVIAFPLDVPSWDPTSRTHTAGQSMYKAVFDSPLHYGADLKLEPRLIREWKHVGTDGRRLEVTLRDDAYFHDGSKVTAEDLRFSWIERPREDKTLQINFILHDIEDVQVVSPTKAVVVFKSPKPTAAQTLAFITVHILPKQYFLKVGKDAFLAKPVGAGPYKVVDYQRGSRTVLEAFDKYWGGAPKIKRLTFEIVPEPSARVAALEAGRADIAMSVPLREVSRLAAKPGLAVKAYPYAEFFVVHMPTSVPELLDENVRNALHFAIDKAALSKAFFGGVAPTMAVAALPGTPAYPAGFDVPFDRAKATEALKKAGYGAGKPLKLKVLATNGTFPADFEMARAIAGMWKNVGIETDVEAVDLPKYTELLTTQKLPGPMVYSWNNAMADPENGVVNLLHPNLRFSAFKRPELAPVFNGLMAEMDEAKRQRGYQAVLREASEHTWVLPLLQSVATIAWKDNLVLRPHAVGYVMPAEISRK